MDILKISVEPWDTQDKQGVINSHIRDMLTRTRNMFKYTGLPDTIPEKFLELYLQVNGNACFYKYEGNLYAFTGGLGGEPDPYYFPTIYTIANPALNLNVSARIGVDCVVMPNDTLYRGLMPLYSRYATALAENELSMRVASINSRMMQVLSADTDRTKESAEKYLKRIEDGDLGVIGEQAITEGIKVQNGASSTAANILTALNETEQYIRASWYNAIGLDANYNMKREALNSSESSIDKDILLPLVDDMLRCRQKALEEVNAMFGTDISVSLASSWEDNQEEADSSLSSREENPPEDENPEEGAENATE